MPDEAPNANTSQTFGKVTKYVVGTDWESYTEQLDFYFRANGVKEPKTKKAVLLMNLPVETYQLAKDLVAPAQLKDYLRYHREANAETTETRKISDGRQV